MDGVVLGGIIGFYAVAVITTTTEIVFSGAGGDEFYPIQLLFGLGAGLVLGLPLGGIVGGILGYFFFRFSSICYFRWLQF